MSASRDDALCAAGIEVWFDQSELRGGDAWDANTREQIETCALFVPLISVHTQSRREGYSRLEWKLADERTHLMAVGTAFLVPVVIDDTKERGALVPKSFLGVQWTRLPGGEVPAEFVTRVRALLGGKVAQASPLALRPEGGETAALHERRRFPKWVWGALAVVVVATAGYFASRPRTKEAAAQPDSKPQTQTESRLSPTAVAPGFINMLSHSQVALLADGRPQGEIRQGVRRKTGPVRTWARMEIVEKMRRRRVRTNPITDPFQSMKTL